MEKKFHIKYLLFVMNIFIINNILLILILKFQILVIKIFSS